MAFASRSPTLSCRRFAATLPARVVVCPPPLFPPAEADPTAGCRKLRDPDPVAGAVCTRLGDPMAASAAPLPDPTPAGTQACGGTSGCDNLRGLKDSVPLILLPPAVSCLVEPCLR